MASIDVWSDYESLRHNVKQNTVDRLKQILTGFNEECGTNCIKSGKKQDLIDRVIREMEAWRRTNATDKWTKARNILNTVRSYGTYTPTRTTSELYSSPTSANGQYPAGAGPSFHQSSGSSTIPRYDPYTAAAPQRPAMPPNPRPAASTSTNPTIRFKPSPFFRVEKLVSSVAECPESNSQMDRRQQSLNFQITPDLQQKLASQSPKYQLRLYCTSSSYYTPTPAFRTNPPCPIEFPPTCEVRVNSIQLQANLKGMKKKPGTAPPPDLGKSVRTTVNATNRVEMIYVNSQQPKYYLVVMLVEVTTVDQLIDRLKKGKYKSSAEVLTKMKQPLTDEDDIVAGHQKMSLKCPLSYMRITTPCRAWSCVHSQCFDAFSWFSVMEQTTTWMCPVCEKTLSTDDLIIDGYFDEIVKATPEEVEDVIVEPDGEWHSEDNAFGSDGWKATHATAELALKSAKARSPTPVKPNIANLEKKRSLPSNAEIVILDSDDEDEGRVKRELSPSYDRGGLGKKANGSRTNVVSVPSRSKTVDALDVIDLTLDSDDEAQPIPPTRKRRADDVEALSPTEVIWKKSRVESVPPAAQPASAPVRAAFASDPASFGVPRQSHPPTPAVQGPPSPSAHRYETGAFTAPSYPVQSTHTLPNRPPTLPPMNGSGYPPTAGYVARSGVGSSNGVHGSWRR
ncbi:PINIT domain-containing protein [Cristinia sonorae]|uniref:PINIT domain-containing protein n=1 Tax=Cristinia sonorae TaxID=1940300 RepID=A0A8K0XPT3_9AGAR|nr:PINIT domain-containing protein [Cristinia sonorae]